MDREIIATIYSAAAFVIILLMLSIIKNKLAVNIYVNIESDRILIKSDTEEVVLEPIIYVSLEGKKRDLLGIGNIDVPKLPSERINLFENIDSVGLPQKRYCFQIFFRHAFRVVSRRKYLVFVKVTIRGTSNLESLFQGEQDREMWKVLRGAGAIECHFLP